MEFCKRNAKKSGFTLVEMLIAMSIFVIFIGILINSYTSIVKAQREANEYRIVYSEARRVFDTLTQEFRDGMFDYANINNGGSPCVKKNSINESVILISKDGKTNTKIFFEQGDEESPGVLKIGKWNKGEKDAPDSYENLNSPLVNVLDFKVYVYPYVDPYDQNFVYDDAYQFHPFVTIFASFERSEGILKGMKVDLQTSISSRIYNQVYPTEKCAQS